MGERLEYKLGDERRRGGWLDYVQGCTSVLREAGHALVGVDLQITSDVPAGSGLSSSAALEVALLRALRAELSLPIDDVALALLGQRAENDFVGAPVGVMDQLVASLGTLGAALFIDTHTLTVRSIPLPAADLIVIASGLHHDHAAGEYRTRRAECERAAGLLGVQWLCELGQDDDRIAGLPPPLDRRVRHVLTENARVLAAVDAIERGDLPAIGALFAASHASMRDDYEVSLPPIDTLVAIAMADPEVYGARLTGGGFGGSIVALATPGAGRAAAKRITRRYVVQTHHLPQVLVAGGNP